MASPPDESESTSEMLDPHRQEEREAVAVELSGRLAQKGVEVGADEDPAQLADLLSAVEEFERTVIAAGGDLMVNSPTSTDPEDETFVLPQRRADEPLSRYAQRIGAATKQIGGHSRR
ncbi:MAG TPA: hypothetical protein VES88_13135 [Gemmatimonadaceae bacterium]|nr:hypothetical protein [Gemmatimonadaceae bacterium]